MTYTFKHGHVSQLEDWHDGSGLNGHSNCAEASLARYLRETAYPFPGSDHELIALLRLRITDLAESRNEGYTSLLDLERYLKALGILDLAAVASPEIAAEPWTISLVRGRDLFPRQYPPSWFGGDAPDHFILSLPGGLFNDPLAFWNGQKDCAYTSLGQAIAGGMSYHLRAPGTFTWKETVAPISSWVETAPGTSAWVETTPGRYLAVSGTVVTKPAAPPKPLVSGLKIGREGANVRSAPHIAARIVKGLAPGQEVPLAPDAAPRSKDELAAPWFCVRLPDGGIGYISHLAVSGVADVRL